MPLKEPQKEAPQSYQSSIFRRLNWVFLLFHLCLHCQREIQCRAACSGRERRQQPRPVAPALNPEAVPSSQPSGPAPVLAEGGRTVPHSRGAGPRGSSCLPPPPLHATQHGCWQWELGLVAWPPNFLSFQF